MPAWQQRLAIEVGSVDTARGLPRRLISKVVEVLVEAKRADAAFVERDVRVLLTQASGDRDRRTVSAGASSVTWPRRV